MKKIILVLLITYFISPLPTWGALIISNSPERITSAGRIFQRKAFDHEFRFIYHHHIPETKKINLLKVNLINPATSTIELESIITQGGPDQDELYTGHSATTRFFKELKNSSYQKISLNPLESFPLNVIKTKDRSTISGVAYLKSSLKVPLEFAIIATGAPQKKEETTLDFRTEGVFDTHKKEIIKTLTVDGLPKIFRIGDRPFIKEDRTQKELAGNYGLLYDFYLTFKNPKKDRFAKVMINFSPAGGEAGGVFLFSDKVVSTIASSFSEKNLKTFFIPPASAREIHFSTMPQPGSSYPVRVIIRSQEMRWS